MPEPIAQLAPDDLATMTADQIQAARARGQLDALLGPHHRTGRLEQLTQADLAGMSADAIVAAKDAGQLADLLGAPRIPDAVHTIRAGGTISANDAAEAARAGYYDDVSDAATAGRIQY